MRLIYCVKRFTGCIFLFAFMTFFSACSLGSIDSIFVESKIITTGRFHHFEVGMDKEHVARTIFFTDDHAVISPVPNHKFVIDSNNLSNIQAINGADGIHLFNNDVVSNHGQSIYIYFAKGKIYKIDKPFANEFQQFKVGDTIQQTITNIYNIIRTNNKLIVIPIVDLSGVRSYLVADVVRDRSSRLFHYNAWKFETPAVKPAGAFYRVYFSKGHLYKIEYRRPRMRIDL